MRILVLIWLSVLVCCPVYAETYSGTCSIRFEGTSFLGDFDGEGGCLPFSVDIIEPDGKGVRTVKPWEILIPVEGMETGLEPRDKSMYRMFESVRYPYIRGTLGGFDPDDQLNRLRSAPEQAHLDFDLTMHGVTRPVRAAVIGFSESSDTLQIVFRFDAQLEEHGMVRPRMFGVPMVGEVISIEIASDLKRRE